MYYCLSCHKEFKEPIRLYETHSLPCPPYEMFLICPHCKNDAIIEKSISHCRCCGVKLMNNQTEYCSKECRSNGEKLWEIERKRRKIAYESSLNQKLREIESYNKTHNTDYSYGQYVALIDSKGKKKCAKKRKTT